MTLILQEGNGTHDVLKRILVLQYDCGCLFKHTLPQWMLHESEIRITVQERPNQTANTTHQFHIRIHIYNRRIRFDFRQEPVQLHFCFSRSQQRRQIARRQHDGLPMHRIAARRNVCNQEVVNIPLDKMDGLRRIVLTCKHTTHCNPLIPAQNIFRNIGRQRWRRPGTDDRFLDKDLDTRGMARKVLARRLLRTMLEKMQ